LFEEADGGTLFLDEIAEMPAVLQVKLLRALQSGEVRRLGATQAATFDVRVIAATNGDLATRISEGSFREDLFYRLNVIHVALPPHVSAGLQLGPSPALPLQITLAEAERAHILQTLERFGRNHSGAADALGIGRTTLWRKLREYGIER